MPKSVINVNYSFDKDVFVVSVLNIGSKLTGHSVLIVEGIAIENEYGFFKDSLFIGQYDILCRPYVMQGSSMNTKGFITDIRMFESHDVKRDYSQYTAKSYYITSQNCKVMLASIQADKAKVERLKNMIEVGEISEDNVDSAFINKHGFLEYHLIGNNCADWCVDKLRIAGVNITALYGKPEIIAGGCNVI